MTTYVVRRLIWMVVVLVVDIVLVFSLVHLTPGDPALMMIGGEAGVAANVDLDAIRRRMGLDQSLPRQLVSYFGRVVRGDLGQSFFSNQPVFETIMGRVPLTFQLAAVSLAIALVVGLPMGVFAALRRNTTWDQGLMIIALVGVSMPNFWLGLLLMLTFAVTLGWLPLIGYVAPTTDPGAWLRHIIMPASALGFSQAALIARITRSSMLEVLRQDYVALTAHAKGLSTWDITIKHALASAAFPVVTVVGLSFASLLGGAVIVEQVFALPGIGSLLINGVSRRDYPVIQGCLLFIAFANVLMNLLVDLSYGFLDPRVRYE
jgi:peptide/nickel transport system permease protein